MENRIDRVCSGLNASVNSDSDFYQLAVLNPDVAERRASDTLAS